MEKMPQATFSVKCMKHIMGNSVRLENHWGRTMLVEEMPMKEFDGIANKRREPEGNRVETGACIRHLLSRLTS